MCVLVLYRAAAGRLEARRFRHTTFSRLCMLLLSSYNFLGVTVNADSNTPQSESGKRAASWRSVSGIATFPWHNPPLTERTVLSKIASLWDIRSCVTTLDMHVSTRRCSYTHNNRTVRVGVENVCTGRQGSASKLTMSSLSASECYGPLRTLDACMLEQRCKCR